ncbi:MAG: hypothetical protein P8100_13825, partial [bacterium]
MIIKRPAIVALLLLCILQPLHTFTQPGAVEYTFEFRFADGIYLSYEEFKNNAPSVTEYRIIDKDGLWNEQVDKVLVVKRIEYKDPDGQKKVLKRKDIWGISYDGQPYYLQSKRFHKIMKVGMIMYIYIPTMNLPDINHVYESPRGQVPITSNFFDATKNLIDFKTGEFYTYTPENFEYLIRDDAELYESFLALPGHASKKHNIWRYLQEYNERHPIYFPTDGNQSFNLDAATMID